MSIQGSEGIQPNSSVLGRSVVWHFTWADPRQIEDRMCPRFAFTAIDVHSKPHPATAVRRAEPIAIFVDIDDSLACEMLDRSTGIDTERQRQKFDCLGYIPSAVYLMLVPVSP